MSAHARPGNKRHVGKGSKAARCRRPPLQWRSRAAAWPPQVPAGCSSPPHPATLFLMGCNGHQARLLSAWTVRGDGIGESGPKHGGRHQRSRDSHKQRSVAAPHAPRPEHCTRRPGPQVPQLCTHEAAIKRSCSTIVSDSALHEWRAGRREQRGLGAGAVLCTARARRSCAALWHLSLPYRARQLPCPLPTVSNHGWGNGSDKGCSSGGLEDQVNMQLPRSRCLLPL